MKPIEQQHGSRASTGSTQPLSGEVSRKRAGTIFAKYIVPLWRYFVPKKPAATTCGAPFEAFNRRPSGSDACHGLAAPVKAHLPHHLEGGVRGREHGTLLELDLGH